MTVYEEFGRLIPGFAPSQPTQCYGGSGSSAILAAPTNSSENTGLVFSLSGNLSSSGSVSTSSPTSHAATLAARQMMQQQQQQQQHLQATTRATSFANTSVTQPPQPQQQQQQHSNNTLHQHQQQQQQAAALILQHQQHSRAQIQQQLHHQQLQQAIQQQQQQHPMSHSQSLPSPGQIPVSGLFDKITDQIERHVGAIANLLRNQPVVAERILRSLRCLIDAAHLAKTSRDPSIASDVIATVLVSLLEHFRPSHWRDQPRGLETMEHLKEAHMITPRHMLSCEQAPYGYAWVTRQGSADLDVRIRQCLAIV
ncbi:unnamed protein product [Protopolystoma xenopodis]|uniref:Uncharacterized protein n=1 Tax=Protopolystoma xenopodis TaxID=117903 RepID=A0A448WDU9_9PLAT|nr:unnamed protein product [Protopolystoma xenopodis]